jgi:hypothetical protein
MIYIRGLQDQDLGAQTDADHCCRIEIQVFLYNRREIRLHLKPKKSWP